MDKNKLTTQPTNSIDSELRQIIGQIPNYIFEYLELSDEIKKEWKHGSKASDFGGHNEFVQKFVAQIKALYISRKEVEEAIGETEIAPVDHPNWKTMPRHQQMDYKYIMWSRNYLRKEIRAKLLPPTKGGN